MSKTVEQLKKAKAIRVTETLTPMTTDIKLPSYAGEKEGKKEGQRFVTWGDNALLDSVQSQANRIEQIFDNYHELVPATKVVYPDMTVNLTDVPHRAADPSISNYFRPELDSIKTNPEALAKRAPTSLIFGICDIRNGRNIKVTRAVASEVIVRGGKMHAYGTSLSTHFTNENRADFANALKQHGLKGSEIGVEQVCDWKEAGTVDVTAATIERTAVFSVEVLEQFESNEKLYDYLFSLALVAVLAPTTTVLRSGTTLIRTTRRVEAFYDLSPVTVIDSNELFDEAVTYARKAAETFGIGQAETLTVNIDKILEDAVAANTKKQQTKAKKAKSVVA